MEISLYRNMWSSLRKSPWTAEKKMYFSSAWMDVLQIPVIM